jgi:uncharacterized phage protein (TIGR02218 family)
MTTSDVSQGFLAAIGAVSPEAEVSQGFLAAIGAVQPVNGVTQAFLAVIGHSVPCVAHRCQLWRIERRDGVTLLFTSHDEEVTWGTEVFRKCKSLMESASEQASELGAVGNIELQGILSDEAISESDLYAGLYDDAFIEVWEKSWDDTTDTIKRIAAGWAGSPSHGEDGFKVEVLGPGERMLQQPLLRTISPGCRWEFGGPECGVDAEALKIAGVAVTAVTSRAFFVCDAVDPMAAAQWDRGKIRWLTGDNAGTVCEVKTVDFATGVVVLWQPSGFVGQVGDTFDLLPGCDLAYDGGCTVYDNKVRNGGFPDVPGTDTISKTPEPKAE